MAFSDLIQQAAALCKSSCRLAVLTGAGVSKESGIPTFRDAMDGLWAQYDPQELATLEAFRRNPSLVWNWYQFRRSVVQAAQPNAGHIALARLQQLCPHMQIITQNVDNLHERAGSTKVIRLHGSIALNRCSGNCQGNPTHLTIDRAIPATGDEPPACPHCGKYIRPDVVWFGEVLPAKQIEHAKQLARTADVMLVIGTSGVVQPAAHMPVIARSAGAKIIEVNPVKSEVTPLAHVWLQGPSAEILPQIIEAIDNV